eukprot:PhF_6_TR8264/c0_g1_i1/m.12590
MSSNCFVCFLTFVLVVNFFIPTDAKKRKHNTTTRTSDQTITMTQTLTRSIMPPPAEISFGSTPTLFEGVTSGSWSVSVTSTKRRWSWITITPSTSTSNVNFSPPYLVLHRYDSLPASLSFAMYAIKAGSYTISFTLKGNNTDRSVQAFTLKETSRNVDVNTRTTFVITGLQSVYRSETGVMSISLSRSPTSGRDVTIIPSAGTKDMFLFSPSSVTLTDTSVKTINYTGNALGRTILSFSLQGTDNLQYYDPPSAVSIYVLGKVNITISSVPTFTYATSSVKIGFTAISPYRDYKSFEVQGAVTATPSLSSVSPQNVTLSYWKVTQFLTLRSDVPGVYKLQFSLVQPYVDSSGSVRSINAPQFQIISGAVQTLIVRRQMNISIGLFPLVYVADPVASGVDSTWGGAWTTPIDISLFGFPRSDVSMSMTSAVGSVEFSPGILYFTPSVRRAQFRMRATKQGTFRIDFTLGGTNSNDYFTPTFRTFVAKGKNPSCARMKTLDLCKNQLSCFWNVAKSLCSNSTLPISVPKFPDLVSYQVSDALSFELPSPAEGAVTIEPKGQTLTFTPSIITIATGQTKASFTVQGVNTGTTSTVVGITFTMTGPGAFYFSQLGPAKVRLLPMITMTITVPQPSFYIGRSTKFTVSFDAALPAALQVTPKASGVSISPGIGSINKGEKSIDFTAYSDRSLTGRVDVAFTISGDGYLLINKPLPSSYVIILPSSELHVPPIPTLQVDVLSGVFHLDVPHAPPNELIVDANSSSTSLVVIPSRWVYNTSQRFGTFQLRATAPGSYTIKYILSGIDKDNYASPESSFIDVVSVSTASGTVSQGNTISCAFAIGTKSIESNTISPVTSDVQTQACSRAFSPINFNRCNFGNNSVLCKSAFRSNGSPCVYSSAQAKCVDALPLVRPTNYAGNENLAMLVGSDLTLYTMGANDFGQLGRPVVTTAGSTFGRATMIDDVLTFGEIILSVVAGSAHGLVHTSKGRVFTWGANHYGQLGHSPLLMSVATPTEIKFPLGFNDNITCVCGGLFHGVAVTRKGVVYSWGWNFQGQLGRPDIFRKSTPAPAQINPKLLMEKKIVSCNAGPYHTTLLTEDNYVWAFGSNTFGELGREGPESAVPVLVLNERTKVQRQLVQNKLTIAELIFSPTNKCAI